MPAGCPKGAPLDLLSGFLPSPTTAAFLLACLAPPPLALQAWERWRAPRSPLQGLVDAEADLRALSAALLHEQLRSRRYRQILAEVLAILNQAGVP